MELIFTEMYPELKKTKNTMTAELLFGWGDLKNYGFNG